MSSRPAYSTQKIPVSQGYTVRNCLKIKGFFFFWFFDKNKFFNKIKNNENELENYFHQVYNLLGHLKFLRHGPSTRTFNYCSEHYK